MKQMMSCLLALAMVFYSAPVWLIGSSPAAQEGEQDPVPKLLESTYLELFRVTPELNLPSDVIKKHRDRLKEEQDREESELEAEEDTLEDRVSEAQDQLEALNRDSSRSPEVEEKRHNLHCQIQTSRQQLQELEVILETGLDTKYENLQAKLDVLELWPERYHQVIEMVQNNENPVGKFGDFRDIGFRGGPFEGQEEDIQTGREAIEQMHRQNIFPPEVEDEKIRSYVTNLASRIARHSDLKVPLDVTILKSEEINAFALPGGFLFVNSGLILKAENESELAGVMAHEISHVAARHSDRLMGKANIANIIYQAAQLAALLLTGGVSSIATYYLLQYGFFGLGLVLNLSLLGVNRDYEIEADILGTQYLWASNYDTEGFMSFFGRMAQEEGYVTGLSWFRTHPPFYERMETTYSEMLYLPQQEDPIRDTDEFQEIKKALEENLKQMEEQDREAPTLRRVYDCDDFKSEGTLKENSSQNQ